uniref:PIG-P domain-containing protein n=1 Tax=Arcella intermedia TaxID=1963864 RepID=A0A6B2LMC5_9EUKA
MATWVGLFAYVGWAFLPDSMLHPLGMGYYPDRYWAIATPMFLLLCWLFSIVVYLALNLIDTAPLDSFQTITDEQANEITESEGLQEAGQIVPIADVPITVVNDILYNTKPRKAFHLPQDRPMFSSLKRSTGIPKKKGLAFRSVSDIDTHHLFNQ